MTTETNWVSNMTVFTRKVSFCWCNIEELQNFILWFSFRQCNNKKVKRLRVTEVVYVIWYDFVGNGIKEGRWLGWSVVQYAATCCWPSLRSVVITGRSSSSRTCSITADTGVDQSRVGQLVASRRRFSFDGSHGRVQRLPWSRRRISSAERWMGRQLDTQVPSGVQLLTSAVAAAIATCINPCLHRAPAEVCRSVESRVRWQTAYSWFGLFLQPLL